jgi:hypothetical protein
MASNGVKTPAEINREPRGQQSQYAGVLTDAETLVDTNAAARRRELKRGPVFGQLQHELICGVPFAVDEDWGR